MTIRRLSIKVERDSAEEALKQVFLALYYRHEFARRNEEVFKAGKDIAKCLGLPEERLKTFVQKGEFLTDAIVRSVEKANTRTKSKRIEALRDYLQKYRILPMVWDWNEGRSFFPVKYLDDVRANFPECQKAFKSLMGFEAYALAVLGVGHPVMFPVMPLRIQGENKDKVVGGLDLDEYEAPMFMDFAAPKTSCDSYLELMSLDNEVGKWRTAALRIRPRKSGEEEYSIQRIKPGVLESHLDVLDVARYWTRENRFYAKAKFYSAVMLKKKIIQKEAETMAKALENRKSGKILTKTEEDELARAFKINEWFSQKLKLAKPYEQAYRDLI